jgi:NADH:ubiquinone oxidoreductase subunit D
MYHKYMCLQSHTLFEFISIGNGTSSYLRTLTPCPPFLDMKESCNIMRQLLDKMPESGEVRAKLQPNPKGPSGETYGRVKSGRGALGYYIVSDGTPRWQIHLSLIRLFPDG